MFKTWRKKQAEKRNKARVDRETKQTERQARADVAILILVAQSRAIDKVWRGKLKKRERTKAEIRALLYKGALASTMLKDEVKINAVKQELRNVVDYLAGMGHTLNGTYKGMEVADDAYLRAPETWAGPPKITPAHAIL